MSERGLDKVLGYIGTDLDGKFLFILFEQEIALFIFRYDNNTFTFFFVMWRDFYLYFLVVVTVTLL